MLDWSVTGCPPYGPYPHTKSSPSWLESCRTVNVPFRECLADVLPGLNRSPVDSCSLAYSIDCSTMAGLSSLRFAASVSVPSLRLFRASPLYSVSGGIARHHFRRTRGSQWCHLGPADTQQRRPPESVPAATRPTFFAAEDRVTG